MFGSAIAFLLGDLIFQQSSSLPALGYLALLPLIWLMSRLPIPGIIWLTWLATGFCWGLAFAHLQADNGFDETCLGSTIVTEGTVIGLPYVEETHSRFDFEVDQVEPSHCLEQGRKVRLRVNWYQASQPINTGERWRLSLKLRKTRNFYNRGGFDYEASLLDQGIRYTAYVKDDPERVGTDSDTGLDKLRSLLAQNIESALPNSGYAGIIQALVVGDRSQITVAQWQTLRRSGTLHLMAISGLHIGMLGALGYFLGAGLWRLSPTACLTVPAPIAGALVALLFALTYSALAGFSLPTQRALIMLSVVMLALVFRRRIHPHTSLALALFIILLLAPFSVNQPGFWLSFIAVGLLLFTIDRHVQDTRIRKWSRAQWVLMVGMLPLNLLFFKGTPLVAPLANLVAIPWIGLTVLPPALLGTFMQHLGFEVGAMLLNLAELSLALIWPVLEYLQGMPIAWLAVSAPGPILLLLAGTGIVLILAPSGWPGRALGGVFLLPLFVTPAPRPEPGGFWIEMLDVGEGLATVIRTREHTLIYDTGPRFSPRFDTGSAVILPYLYQNQINRIDTLIISHGDNDHIGGAHSLMDALPVQRILTSVPEKLNADVEYCMEGQTWSWDGVQFQVLHPKRDWPFTGNNGSCVLRVHNMQNSVLLTGDIESISEFRLRRDLGDTLASDILFIPHHGSLTSSTSELIMTVEPDLALVSAGYQNRFGFPKEEVTKRYTERGIPILNTAEYGAVHIEFTANGRTPRIEPYLSIHQRYWYSGLDSLP